MSAAPRPWAVILLKPVGPYRAKRFPQRFQSKDEALHLVLQIVRVGGQATVVEVPEETGGANGH